MMLEYMLDTNICIYVIKRQPPEVQARFDEVGPVLCISTITLAELQHGVEKSSRRAENAKGLESFVSRLQVLPFSAQAAVHFGQIKAELQRAGTLCGPFDLQIGAHARSEGLVLVTNNRREFDRMPGLRVENWVG